MLFWYSCFGVGWGDELVGLGGCIIFDICMYVYTFLTSMMRDMQEKR